MDDGFLDDRGGLKFPFGGRHGWVGKWVYFGRGGRLEVGVWGWFFGWIENGLWDGGWLRALELRVPVAVGYDDCFDGVVKCGVCRAVDSILGIAGGG